MSKTVLAGMTAAVCVVAVVTFVGVASASSSPRMPADVAKLVTKRVPGQCTDYAEGGEGTITVSVVGELSPSVGVCTIDGVRTQISVFRDPRSLARFVRGVTATFCSTAAQFGRVLPILAVAGRTWTISAALATNDFLPRERAAKWAKKLRGRVLTVCPG